MRSTHNRRVDLWRNLCTSLWYFVVRVRCRRTESSRSLSHLLMSFLFLFHLSRTGALDLDSHVAASKKLTLYYLYYMAISHDSDYSRLMFVLATVLYNRCMAAWDAANHVVNGTCVH